MTSAAVADYERQFFNCCNECWLINQMGNKTSVQIQSRVEKYFLKLHYAGLPIPGRPPPQRNKNQYFRQGKARRGGTGLKGGSTFLASVVPEVTMADKFEDKERR